MAPVHRPSARSASSRASSALVLGLVAACSVACSSAGSTADSPGAAGSVSTGGNGASTGGATATAGSGTAGAVSASGAGGAIGAAGSGSGAGSGGAGTAGSETGAGGAVSGGGGASGGGATGASGAGTAGAAGSTGAAGAGAAGSAGAPATGTFPFKPSYVLGADISWTLEDEAGGAKYADATGVKPIEQIMANNGFNFVRLRTFVCPSCAGGYNSKGFCDDKHTVIMAKRVKACGMGVFLDFHMADTWVSLGTGASASAQPSAWKGMTPSQMQTAAYNYTNMVVKEMADAGVTPDMVQIGNETNAGMSGIPLSNWKDLSALIEAGIQGVKDVNPNIGIWVQNGRPRPDSAGGNNFDGWIDDYLGTKGTKLDIDGVCGSTYGTTNSGADWIESFSYVLNTYKKPVMSCEYTVASPDNNAGQIINTKVMRAFSNHMGIGSFIWEPTRYPAVNSNTLFTKNGNTYTTNAAMSAYPTLAKSYGMPVPSAKCVGDAYTN